MGYLIFKKISKIIKLNTFELIKFKLHLIYLDSQNTPVNPGLQTHLNLLRVKTSHVPPLAQTFVKQEGS